MLAALDVSVSAGGGMHADLELIGCAGRIGDPLGNIHIHGLLIDGGGGRHTIVVGGRRLDGGIRIHVYREGGRIGQAGLVFDRVGDIGGGGAAGRGEGDHVVFHAHPAETLDLDMLVDGQIGVVAGDVVLRDRHGCGRIGPQRDFVIPGVYAGVGRSLEYAHADLRLCALTGPILHGIGEGVGAGRIRIRFIDQVVGTDFGYAAQRGCLVAQTQQLIVVAIRVYAGQCDGDADLLSGGNLRFGVMRGWRGLARCVALMHGNGDIGGSHITQIVFNRIGDGEVAGLAGCLVADRVSRDEGQTLERLLVVLQVVLELDRGAIRVGHMVKHIHGHDAAGAHLGIDIAGLGH